MAVNIIGAVIALLVIMGIIVSTIGYVSFTNSFKKEYAETTYHMANTAALLINGDNVDAYLAGKEKEEYKTTKENLDLYCKSINVTIVYLIKVDTSDYGRFVSVFNCINNSVGNTNYTEWELGHKRDTTNDEYAQKYKALYNKESTAETVYRTHPTDGQIPHITTLVPVTNSNGDVVSILCMQRPMSELDSARDSYLIRVGISTVILALIAAAFAITFIKNQFIKPIKTVSDEATRFAKENSKGVHLGKISKFDDIYNLAGSIDTMETDMLNYIENLTSITAEKERIGAELTVASVIQENSIPNIFPAFPERKDFDIYGSMTPAKAVGGDFYNFFLVDEDHLAFVIGDVSGKGVPAALFMMVTNILVSDRTRMGGTPAEILKYVNENICEHNKADMFVTLWLGILEVSTGKITAANAGHDDAAIYRNGESFELLKTKHNLVVGAMAGLEFTDFEIQLNKGDKLFLYTDGVPEATNEKLEMFSSERMVEALNKYKEQCPEDILDGIRISVNEFVGSAPQFDDLTMLCIELNGDEDDSNELTVEAKKENLAQVIDFVDSFLEKNDCSMRAQMQIDLSVEELFVNIANYAYEDKTGTAGISIGIDGREVTIVLKDEGIPYNPLDKPDPDTSLSAQDREIGGLGIFLVKKNMDSVSYEYADNKNILTMKKMI